MIQREHPSLIKFTVLVLLRFSRENKHFPLGVRWLETWRPGALLAPARAAVRWQWGFTRHSPFIPGGGLCSGLLPHLPDKVKFDKPQIIH